MLQYLTNLILDVVGNLGYLGIFLGMGLESSFIPFPSEVIMIPAGYLAHQGEMNPYYAIFFGILGTLFGSSINYILGKKLAKPILIRYGKYFLISEKTLQKSESFFKNHGEISIFIGRLIPGVRQLISMPAGAFGMSFFKFLTLTAFGGGIWVVILTYFGYFIGDNASLIAKYMIYIKLGLIIFVAMIALFYIYFKLKGKKS